ncbi:YihY/virulence factor BrkB family protein [uncultured Oscillibacter sp.]|uniref:YihY/virulence factor BrkB family protein n=1 Tax=uncultured Oscillibacter sp. TaxID=876091 RepID=UPI0025E6CA0B|nr:YihY/virulence factor BrkB family protein [uncultured Oscillibacter sp.]
MLHTNLPKNRLFRGAYLMVRRYLRHGVGIQSAALAFYLLFAVFPMLIFVSALLGLLHLDVASVLADLHEILPKVAVDFIGVYLIHVEENSNVRLLLFGLVFSIFFPMRAANTLMRSVRTAYRLGPPRQAALHLLRTLIYTVLLLVTLTLTLVLMSVSNTVLQYAVAHLHLPAFAARLWSTLRFPLAGAAAGFALLALYALTQDTRQPWKNLLPGVVASLAAWLVLSWIYAAYMENIANYSLLYGSIGTAMALLVWLYMTAVTLIMGAELNGTLISLRRETPEEF